MKRPRPCSVIASVSWLLLSAHHTATGLVQQLLAEQGALSSSSAQRQAHCFRRHDTTTSTSPLYMTSDDHLSTVFPAQDALKSPSMARTIRKVRSSQTYRRTMLSTTETNQGVAIKTKNNNTTTNPCATSSSSPSRIKQTSKQNEDTPQQTTHRKEHYDRLIRIINHMDLPYNSALQTLQAYHAVHGDLVIPRRYRVPHKSPFPPEWYGADLARTVYHMKWWQKHVKSKPSRVAELNRLGFVWERLQPEWNLVLEALIIYSTLYGHVMVPNRFVVPVGDVTDTADADADDEPNPVHKNTKNPWPRATWGIPLGSCVYRIRARNDFLRGPNGGSRRDQLDGLGFVWDVQEHRFQIFYKCLYQYAKLNECGPFSPVGEQHTRALKVPATFVVPPNDPRWSRDLWEYPLGVKCHAVRQKQLYVKNSRHRQQLLEELGFRWSGNADLGWLQVVHAAAIYSRMHNRQLDVPYHFVVPSAPSLHDAKTEDWPWPEYLWGLPLGQRLKDVRLKGAYLKGKSASARRRQLDTLGFNWQPKRGRRKKQTTC